MQSATQRPSNMKDRSNYSLFIVGQPLLIHPTQIASNNQNRRSSLYQRRHPRLAETNADTLGNQVAKAKTWITLAAMKTGKKRSLMIRLKFVQRKSAQVANRQAHVAGNGLTRWWLVIAEYEKGQRLTR
jgi:hypothetical protein